MLSQVPEEDAAFLRGYGRISKVTIVGFLQRLYNASLGLYLEEGMVPTTTYWVYDGRKLVGIGRLRHELNEALEKKGGNCGGRNYRTWPVPRITYL